MRTLNEHTWEIWFLDYLEGNLTEEEILRLEEYVRHHPERKNELEEAGLVFLQKTYVKYPHTGSLQRNIRDLERDSFEHYCIAALEGDLSSGEETAFYESLESDPEKKNIFELYHKTKLPAEPIITYPGKASLRKTAVRSLLWYRIVPAAAAIAAIILLWNVLSGPGKTRTAPVNRMAEELTEQTLPTGGKKSGETEPGPAENKLAPETEKTEPPKPVPASEFTARLVSGEEKNSVPLMKPVDQEFREPLEKMEVQAFYIPPATTASLALHPVEPSDILMAETREPHTLWQNISQNIRKFISEEKNTTVSAEPIKMYEVADAGITGVNKILGWNMDLKPTTNEEGKLKALAFNSKTLSFRTPLKKEE